MPTRFTNILSALYTSVVALPILHSPHNVRICMRNGLKQGCPLSPLLYLIALDPLLSSFPTSIDRIAFADDTAAGTPGPFNALLPIFPLIEAFNLASGSVSNLGKTHVISTTLKTQTELKSLLPDRWKKVTLKPSHTYLGIPFGPAVNAGNVFDKAIRELQRRAAAYQPLHKRYTQVQDRVTIANVFLLPTLAYTQRFYLMNENTLGTVWSVLRKWVLNDVTRTSIRALCKPREQMGLYTPLRNPESQNLATILRLRSQRELALPRFGPPPWASESRTRTVPLTTTTHIQEAVRRFTASVGERPEVDAPQRVLSDLLAHADPQPWMIFKARVSRRFKEGKMDGTVHSHAEANSLGAALTTQVKAAASTAPKMPKEVHSHLYQLIHHMVPTHICMRWYHHVRDYSCRLCGRRDESIGHLLSPVGCQVTRDAIRVAQGRAPHIPDIALLQTAPATAFELRPAPERRLIPLFTSFSLATIRTCQRMNHLRHPNPEAASFHLVNTFLDLLKTATTKPRRQSRKAKETRNREFQSTLRGLPPLAYRVFTDGSSLAGTRAGAGFWVSCPHLGPLHYESIPLHPCSNNVAELLAISSALEYLTQALQDDPSPLPVQLFTDNAFSLNTIQRRWRTRAHRTLVEETAAKLERLRQFTTVHLFWVPGHAGVYDNEVADYLAKQGSFGIASTNFLTDNAKTLIMQECI